MNKKLVRIVIDENDMTIFHRVPLGSYFIFLEDQREIPHLFKKTHKRLVYDTITPHSWKITKQERHAECYIGIKQFESIQL